MIRVNPDRWLPMTEYVRLIWYTATHDIGDSPYNEHKTQFQRRMTRIKTIDGPIHTAWVWKTRIRYNWFTIGWRCWLKGHDWVEQYITTAPQKEIVKGEAGVLNWKNTGK